MQELTNTDPYEVDPLTGAPIDLWPTEQADDQQLTVEVAQVVEWLNGRLAVESVRTLTGWTHSPVTRWPAQSPPAPALPRRVPPLRRRSDARPLPSAGLPTLIDAKPDDALPGVVSGLIPLSSTGEGQ